MAAAIGLAFADQTVLPRFPSDDILRKKTRFIPGWTRSAHHGLRSGDARTGKAALRLDRRGGDLRGLAGHGRRPGRPRRADRAARRRVSLVTCDDFLRHRRQSAPLWLDRPL